MCFLRFLVSTHNLGFTFGASFSSPHIPVHRPPNPYILHLVEKCCNGRAVSVNNLVAKWRRSADRLLCLPPPFISTLCVPFSTTRGRNEAGVSFVTGFSQSIKRGLKESSSLLHPHVFTRFLEIIHGREWSQTRCSLGNTVSSCSQSPARGLTSLLFDKVHVHVRLRDLEG